MKTSIKFLSLLLSIFVLSGCASTCKKSSAQESQNAPVASSPVVAAQPVAAPVAEPVADEIPVATRKYVNK
ncbi:MAG: hypothetical protein WC133_05360 [Candidatus Omnitrophota bacterium]